MQTKLLHSQGDHKGPLSKGAQVRQAHHQRKGVSIKAKWLFWACPMFLSLGLKGRTKRKRGQ